jgi:hypothetical protein
MLGMESLDHKTAAFIIPPEDVWGPIQPIRQKHDSKVGRWMPHVTLIYSFLTGNIASLMADTTAPPGLREKGSGTFFCLTFG